MSSRFSVQEIIEIAIEIEKNGVSFYETLKNLAKTSTLRDLFKYLAGEEKKHVERFREILKSAGGYQVSELYYATEYMGYMKAIADENVFRSDIPTNELIKDIKDEKGAIDLAIRFEKESILFLHEMLDVIDQTQDTAPIQKLLNEEREHLSRLTLIKRLMN